MSESSTERPAGGILTRRRAAGTSSGLADASPTWELELLISGAVLVALFQLSGVVDRAFDRLAPHATEATEMAISLSHYYGKAIVVALIATFVVHLASRGYWVGLIGLHSVFPGGVRWDDVRYGPTTRELMRERVPSLPAVIGRLDNFCSVLFSFGFLLVLFFGLSLLLMGLLGAVAYVIALVAFDGRGTATIFWTLFGIYVFVPAVVALADRRLSSRLNPDGRAARLLRRGAIVSLALTGMGFLGPVFLTLRTNSGRAVFDVVFFSTFMGILVFVAAQQLVRREALEFNNYAYFARADRFSVDASHYESQRQAGEALPIRPTIQSDVIREPFVKLFIPYVAQRHNRALATACSGIEPLQPVGVRISRRGTEDHVPDSAATAVLRCFARLHPVTLNGAPLANLEWRFHVNPRNALRGVIAYIPTAGLPRGLNVITVQRPPPGRRERRRPDPPRPYVIPFWL